MTMTEKIRYKVGSLDYDYDCDRKTRYMPPPFVLDKWRNQVFECLNLGYWKCFLLFLQCISTKFADRLSKFCGTFHQNCIAALGRITFVLLHLYFCAQ